VVSGIGSTKKGRAITVTLPCMCDGGGWLRLSEPSPEPCETD